MLIVCEQRDDHWSAWRVGHPETAFGGRTPNYALHRLCAALGITVPDLAVDNERTTDTRLCFTVGEPCDVCGGSGRYVGLTEAGDCRVCGGSGRV